MNGDQPGRRQIEAISRLSETVEKNLSDRNPAAYWVCRSILGSFWNLFELLADWRRQSELRRLESNQYIERLTHAVEELSGAADELRRASERLQAEHVKQITHAG